MNKIIILTVLLLLGLSLNASAGFFDDDEPDVFDPDFHEDRNRVVEDSVDISIIDRKVLGIIKGETIISKGLSLGEEVLLQRTEGLVGLVMTDKRLLALSTFTSNWIEHQLNLNEVSDKKPIALVSDFLILVITPSRLLGFDSKGNEWITKDVVLHDDVVTAEIDKRVAVVITTDRAVGLAHGSAFFDSIRFMNGEKVISVKTRPLNVNVLTNKRLLVFRSTVSMWREFDADAY